jgi:hypothetical protein
MIGTQPTGIVEGVAMSTDAADGLIVTFNGKPAVLAVIADGQVVAIGEDVAREAEAVAINGYRNFLQLKGWVRARSREA